MEAFKKFDKNGDGTAEREEIITAVQEICHVGRTEAVTVLHVSFNKKPLIYVTTREFHQNCYQTLAYCSYTELLSL